MHHLPPLTTQGSLMQKTLLALTLSALSLAAAAECVDTTLGARPSMPSESMAIPSRDGRTENNLAARVGGGVGGALIGALLTQNSGAALQMASVVVLGFLGQTAGDILTRNTVDEDGNPVIKVGTDARGRPVYESVLVGPIRPGMPVLKHISPDSYANALDRASAPKPARALSATNGTAYLTLDNETHCNLYRLMVDTVAKRLIAMQAMLKLNEADVKRSVTPASNELALEFHFTNLTYKKVFYDYSRTYQQLSKALSVAESNHYDVSAQVLLMQLVPGDIKLTPGCDLDWPGVAQRLEAITSAVQAEHDNALKSSSVTKK